MATIEDNAARFAKLDAMLRQLTPAHLERMSLAQRDNLNRIMREYEVHRAHTNYPAWCRAIMKRENRAAGLSPGLAPHHEYLVKRVEDVITMQPDADGRYPRPNKLLVSAPPGSAKSTFLTKLLPLHMMNRKHGFKVIGISNTASLAEDFSKTSMSYIDKYPTLMKFGSPKGEAKLWRTANDGKYKAIGVDGASQGFRADGVIIDDPVAGLDDVASVRNRDKLFNKYISEVESRATPNAWVIIICTRWHEDDLIGRLIKTQKSDWEVINIQAEALEGDILGRQPGEFLWSGDPKYPYGQMLARKKKQLVDSGAIRYWNALYQGMPTADEGDFFKIDKMPVIYEKLVPIRVVRAWDLAATESNGSNDPDYTVGAKLGELPNGKFVILDIVRFRGTPDEVKARILETAKKDGPFVEIFMPQDPGQAGKSQVAEYEKTLKQWRFTSRTEGGSKTVRAIPFSSNLNIGNVYCAAEATPGDGYGLSAEALTAMQEELKVFPNGSHDDQVDALSSAYNLIAHKVPFTLDADDVNAFVAETTGGFDDADAAFIDEMYEAMS